jgi:hypothetical protein
MECPGPTSNFMCSWAKLRRVKSFFHFKEQKKEIFVEKENIFPNIENKYNPNNEKNN